MEIKKGIQKKAKSLKILAPAGDWPCLRAAIKAGADAVYLGITNFNMRSTGARNFHLKDLSQISKLCKENNVEFFLTVNTVMYNSDLPKMRKVIDLAKKNDFSGVIVSDFAAIKYAEEVKMPLCISTQLSVSNIDAVRYFAQFSNRIILARELSLKQVKEIVKQIEKEDIRGPEGKLVEIEIFGHGALCVAVSGRCNMSIYCYNKSANRGECTQICRRAYKVTDLETGQELKVDNNYVMSPKDLSTVGLLPKIIDAGVKVLKIEGRGRPPEYVDTVVRIYKKAQQTIIEGSYSKEMISAFNKELGTVFNRGLSNGLYMGQDLNEWAQGAGNQSKNNRVYVGKVLHYFPKKSVALVEVLTKITAKRGDNCLVIGNKTGLVKLTLEKIVVNQQEVNSIQQKDQFTIKVQQKVRKNDDFFIIKTSPTLDTI